MKGPEKRRLMKFLKSLTAIKMVGFKVLKSDCIRSFKGTMYAKDFVREINNQVKRVVSFHLFVGNKLVSKRELNLMKMNCVKFAA